MGHTRIRLGPFALLLAVIGICMTTLGILSIVTANADLRVARKYADMVTARYGLETEGQVFLGDAGDAILSGKGLSSLPDTETDADGITWKEIGNEEGKLTIGVRTDGEGKLEVVCWRIGREWEPGAGTGNLWNGQ